MSVNSLSPGGNYSKSDQIQISLCSRLDPLLPLHPYTRNKMPGQILGSCLIVDVSEIGLLLPSAMKVMFSQASVILSTRRVCHTSPRADNHPWADGYCCGRYASYWNAFLFCCDFDLFSCVILQSYAAPPPSTTHAPQQRHVSKLCCKNGACFSNVQNLHCSQWRIQGFSSPT